MLRLWCNRHATRCYALFIRRRANVNAQRLRGPEQPRAACRRVMSPIPMGQTSVVVGLVESNHTRRTSADRVFFGFLIWLFVVVRHEWLCREAQAVAASTQVSVREIYS